TAIYPLSLHDALPIYLETAAVEVRSPARRRRMLGNRPMSEWVAQYTQSHQHPINRFCHAIGIPLIAVSVPLFVVAVFVRGFWPVPVALFVTGWIFQFVGHG